MKPKRTSFWYIAGSAAMIVAAIALTALINFAKPDTTTTDVRARAGASTLQLVGTADSVDEATGTIVLTNVQLSEDSRSGPAKDLGTWTVTPPPSFSILQATPGVRLLVTIQASTFDIENRNVVATDIKVTR